MLRKRILAAGLAILLIAGLVGVVALLPSPRAGLSGWQIVRTAQGIRLDVPLGWAVQNDRSGTSFTAESFRARMVVGRTERLPVPAGLDRRQVAEALGAATTGSTVSLRGATARGQTLLVVKRIAPGRYAGLLATADPGAAFPQRGQLEEVVAGLRYGTGSPAMDRAPFRYWLAHVQDVRQNVGGLAVRYDLLVPDGNAPAGGWPVLVLAHAATASYASIARDGLAIVVAPHLTWNSFEDDRRVLDAVLTDVAANNPANVGRLLLHGCSVGGRFTFQYAVAEPERLIGAVPMAAFDLSVPRPEVRHVPFVFFWGDGDPLYDESAREAVEGMQRSMDSVRLFLDVGRGHYCDPLLGLEAIRTLLAR